MKNWIRKIFAILLKSNAASPKEEEEKQLQQPQPSHRQPISLDRSKYPPVRVGKLLQHPASYFRHR